LAVKIKEAGIGKAERSTTMKKEVIVAAVLVAVAAAATAEARVNLNVNVDIPVPVAPAPAPMVSNYPPPAYPPPAPVVVAPPPVPAEQVVIQEPPNFLYSPNLGFYVSVGSPYDMVYLDNGYYLYRAGYWYYSPYYYGPWSYVGPRRLPMGLRRYKYEQIRRFRDHEYRAYMRDREHYRGNWYRPQARGAERREERREHRDERREHRDERRDDRH
jgi:hypothetical protein